jgi:translation initiation factor 1
MSSNDWKDRLGIVYSTNSDFQYEVEEYEEQETLPANQQKLRVKIEKAGRKGKVVTLITGFVGTEDDLKLLAKQLKTRLSIGGSSKDSEIVLQGDVKQRVVQLLIDFGYKNSK